MVPSGLLYTSQHEWLKVEGAVVTVGITEHAQEALGDVTFVELPAVGTELAKGQEACPIESSKAAASIYAPAAGKVVEVNGALEDNPGRINSDPHGAGWVYKLEVVDESDLASLMNAEQYEELLAKES